MITNHGVIEALDYFVEESGNEEALGDLRGNSAGAKIKKFVFVDLARGCAMGATDVVRQDFEARHRISFGVIAEEKVANLLIGVGEMSVRFHADEPAENRAGAIIERVFVKQVASRARRDVVLQCACVEFLLVFRHRDSEQIAAAAFTDEPAETFEPRIFCAHVQVQAHS